MLCSFTSNKLIFTCFKIIGKTTSKVVFAVRTFFKIQFGHLYSFNATIRKLKFYGFAWKT